MDKDTRWSLRSLLFLLLAVTLFLLSIDMLGLGLNRMAGSSLVNITTATSNPFIGLFIGLLVTAILQSSSTTSSLAVAAVASGAITLENAIPMIIGANVGTTITSTIVAFGFITKGNEFERAMSAAMLHNMFNILGVILIFPLELNYHFLQDLSYTISSSIPVASGSINSFWLSQFFDVIGLFILKWTGRFVLLVVSIVLLFAAIKMLSQLLYTHMLGSRKERFQNIVFKNSLRSLGWGMLMTAVVQSSSLTTSLIVPLVATGKVSNQRAFQFIMGANIGTTITAILAALFRSEAAMSLAIVHFLFNVIVTLIFLILPLIGKIPVFCAEKISYLMARYRISALVYITLIFFTIPFSLIYFNKAENDKPPVQTETKNQEEP
jgi:sodium-dependent phosphate cotransporter